MKYKALRSFIRSKNIDMPYDLSNCIVVYDGKSFFNKDRYKLSGCQYFYGTECDRYANYLKRQLNWLKKCGVTSYVIFSGGVKTDLEMRKGMHENLINNRCQIRAENVKNNVFDPIFAKNVHLEVLDELGIRYFFCMYNQTEAIISLAKKLCAPVVTNYIEYCFYGVTCIEANTIMFDSQREVATCKIYKNNIFASNIGVHICYTPLLLALLDEDSQYFGYLPGVILGQYQRVVNSLIYWMRRKNKDDAKRSVISCLRNDSDKKIFLDAYAENENILKGSNWDVVRYFQRKQINFIKEGDWFLNGVSNNRIAAPYINLTKVGILSGCWLVPDVKKDDALLAAIDIIGFVHCLLTSSQSSVLTFVGRKNNECCIWDIERKWDTPIPHDAIFEQPKNWRNKTPNAHFDISTPFGLFLHESLKGFDYESLIRLRQDGWILIITLVYYIKKRNKIFVNASYCVILSYVMLGYVSEIVGIIEQSNLSVINNVYKSIDHSNGLLYKDCKAAMNTLMDLFYIQDLEKKFNCTILHEFAEFQHCLQHMNFLNKLCGVKVTPTIYYKTINGTFIYNVFFAIKDKVNPLEHLKQILGQTTVTSLFMNIVDVFNKCLTSVGDN